jgi:hypothetical protein
MLVQHFGAQVNLPKSALTGVWGTWGHGGVREEATGVNKREADSDYAKQNMYMILVI